MLKKLLCARYGEIHLKGGNRGFFLSALKKNLQNKTGKDVIIENSRIIINDCDDITAVANTFGIVSVSPVVQVKSNKTDIFNYLQTLKFSGTFKVDVNRADKNFPYKSPDFAAMCGELLLQVNPSATVDVHKPNKTVFIDIRENNYALIYDEVIPGVGGMPVGTAGRSLVLLSGGIDSPVAAYLAAKRGLMIDCVHFASPPYTSDFALEKVAKLKKNLEKYCGKINLYIVPFTEIQEQIKSNCRGEFMITLMRRFMIRISEKLCKRTGAQCIVTGESLSQVASQTVQGIASNNYLAGRIPVLRPLITFDKNETVEIARKIGTYDTSIMPYEDCCTVFVPKHPSIKPNIEKLEAEEARLDVDTLVDRAVSGANIFTADKA